MTQLSTHEVRAGSLSPGDLFLLAGRPHRATEIREYLYRLAHPIIAGIEQPAVWVADTEKVEVFLKCFLTSG